MQKRLHVLGLPWTQTTEDYLTCAYTQKVAKFTGMMMDEGYEVFLYSGEENTARCTEHIPLITEKKRRAWFGKNDQGDAFSRISWEPNDPWWRYFNTRAAGEVAARAEPHDFLCLTTSTQLAVADTQPDMLPVEWAVGYEGVGPRWRIFESYAWMHHVYGRRFNGDGEAFDAVIPNFFDPAHFPVTQEKDDYLLFIGRVVSRKGPHVAAMIAERTGRKLLVAGPGVKHAEHGKIVAEELSIEGGDIEYVGPVGIEERARLMGGAAAVLVPTQYIEPFGGVAVEAMMCGTPVVTTDWGAFTETVPEGVGGYRFRTLQEGAEAVEKAVRLHPHDVARYAHGRYTLGAVGPQFDRHFERLSTLWAEGWFA